MSASLAAQPHHLSVDHGLPKEKFRTVRVELLNLVSLADARKIEYEACNKHALEFLKQTTPVARNRGLFFIIFDDGVHVGTGQQVIARNQWQRFFGYTRGMSITFANEDSAKLDPQYHFLNLAVPHYRPGGGQFDDMYHARLDYRKLANPSGSAVLESTFIRGTASDFSDLWWLPDPDPHRKKSFYVYCADAVKGRGLQLWKLDENNEFKRENWWPPTKSPLSQIRVVAAYSVLPDDPHKDAMPDQMLKSTGGPSGHFIAYGTLPSSLEIYVDRLNERCYVPAPWSYNGIAVDPYFLWVFSPTPNRFTCATHASIMKCIETKGATPPRWLTARTLDQFSDGEKLVDLCPCDDGTLFISSTRTLYTAAYRNDLEAGTIAVEPWTRFAHNGESKRVQKLPIPCWQVFESLKADLAETKAA
jgi:hypothetical protein